MSRRRRVDTAPRAQAIRPRLLIVNADDFGLTTAVSLGILRAHRDGIVTSTSVLATGPAFGRTAPLLHDACDIGVGVHLAAVGEDPPLLEAREIPSLTNRKGRFPTSWTTFVAGAMAGRTDPDDLRREFSAQIERVQAIGLPITHLDTHQHLHLWPPVREVVLELARRYDIRAVRVPRVVRDGAVSIATRFLARSLDVRRAHVGLAAPDVSLGLDPSSAACDGSLVRYLDRLACNGQTAELWVHPGEHVDDERSRYRWGYQWGAQLDVLVAPVSRYWVASRGFTLGNFARLARVAPA